METSNSTEAAPADAHAKKFAFLELAQIVCLILISVIGIVGNQVVIYVFGWKKRNSRRRFETLLLLLAICDFVASLVDPPAFIYAIATHFSQWHFGFIGCKLILSTGPANITISQGILVLISYERYRSVANPLGETLKKSFFILWLICTLLLSIILVSPYTYSLEIVIDANYSMNTCAPSGTKLNAFYIFAIGNISRDLVASLSLVVLGVMTTRMMKQAKILTHQTSSIKKRRQNTTKATKMLVVVACVFTICIIPLDLFQVMVYSFFHADFIQEHYSSIVLCNTFLHILQMSNSASNIVVYSRMHTDFTRGILACGQRSKDLVRESTRMTFRSIRSASGVRKSLVEELNILNGGDVGRGIIQECSPNKESMFIQ